MVESGCKVAWEKGPRSTSPCLWPQQNRAIGCNLEPPRVNNLRSSSDRFRARNAVTRPGPDQHTMTTEWLSASRALSSSFEEFPGRSSPDQGTSTSGTYAAALKACPYHVRYSAFGMTNT